MAVIIPFIKKPKNVDYSEEKTYCLQGLNFILKKVARYILLEAICIEFDKELNETIEDYIDHEGLMDEEQAIEWVAANLSPSDVWPR